MYAADPLVDETIIIFVYHPYDYRSLTSKDILEINNLVVSQWFIGPHKK